MAFSTYSTNLLLSNFQDSLITLIVTGCMMMFVSVVSIRHKKKLKKLNLKLNLPKQVQLQLMQDQPANDNYKLDTSCEDKVKKSKKKNHPKSSKKKKTPKS
jgi:hypothetical protein